MVMSKKTLGLGIVASVLKELAEAGSIDTIRRAMKDARDGETDRTTTVTYCKGGDNPFRILGSQI